MRTHAWARGVCAPLAVVASIAAGGCGSDLGGFVLGSAGVPPAQGSDHAAGALTERPAVTAGLSALDEGDCPEAPPRVVPVVLSNSCRGPAGPLGERPAPSGTPPGRPLPDATRNQPRHADVQQGDPRVGAAGEKGPQP
jgi:hypothetical protein